MKVTPTREEFTELAAGHSVIPVSTVVLADRHTAVSAFERLAGDEGPAFLLESVEGGERSARWSFIGWHPLFTIVSRDGATEVKGRDLEVSGDPLSILEQVVESLATPDLEGLPPLHTGLVGYLAYDAVRHVEHLPDRPVDDRALPESMWLAVGSLAALDRVERTVTLIQNVIPGDDPGTAWDEATSALGDAIRRLSAPAASPVEPRPDFERMPQGTVSLERGEFESAVKRAVEHIRAGDAFQIVPSLRIEVPFRGSALDVYRALRLLNPSPYMFFLRGEGLSIAGSSPELMARVRDGRVFSRPIAGTRRRGETIEEDAALEAELLSDPKERAEHVMLVDLARNDLGRVSEFGSVTVDDLMVIERYSHVMHIVSGVSGRLRPGVGPVDVLRATFPHGTVSGAPKVRAMEIIDGLEPVARGPYAGAVGYIDFSGNLDTAIALRTMVAADGKAWVQAGAGVVVDSDPAREWEECMEKAAAVLAAIGAAIR